MDRLSGCTCLITGASRGLGESLAHTFWTGGANLFLVARHSGNLDRLVARLGKRSGQNVTAFAADLAEPAEVENIVGLVKAKSSRLDVLINNAAIQGPVGPLWENDWREWLRTLQINLVSPVAICRKVAPLMIGQGGGCIVNVSGGGGTGPRPNFTAYAAAKSALVRFSETLAEELRPYNVRVNCIAPGAMNTSMPTEVIRHGAHAAGEKEYAQAVKVQQDGDTTMRRAAELCAFLASNACSGITGKLISAVWDPWTALPSHLDDLSGTDIYTLRRVIPKDRGKTWGNDS